MTDTRELVEALQQAAALEQRARAHWTAHKHDVPERDASLVMVRHATALKRSLEQWIAARALRAALKAELLESGVTTHGGR
jgi:hypothetical protein